MTDLMIDIETAAGPPDGVILNIAAQQFDPFSRGYSGESYYARIDLESQPDRKVSDDTLAWWAKQPAEALEEAFGEDNRVPLEQALDDLHKIAWRSNRIWVQGPQFDGTLLEHAYYSRGKTVPWQFWKMRDSRTLISLVPSLTRPPTTHHALEDVRRQITLVQDALDFLKVRELT